MRPLISALYIIVMASDTVSPQSQALEDDQLMEDQSPDCGPWADAFECEKNPEYMVKECLESCYLHDRVHTAVLSGKASRVECNSTIGSFAVEVHPTWAPWGANRFLKLVEDGFFDGTYFHDGVPRSHVGFGLGVDAQLVEKWARYPAISDDSLDGQPTPGGGFKKGMVSFVSPKGERHGRTTEVFIALTDNDELGHQSWETPVGVVTEGLAQLRAVEVFPAGSAALRLELLPLAGPSRKDLLTQHFPDMPYITRCRALLPADQLTQQQAVEEETAEKVVEAEAMRHGTPSASAAAKERQERRARLRREEAIKKRTEDRKKEREQSGRR